MSGPIPIHLYRQAASDTVQDILVDYCNYRVKAVQAAITGHHQEDRTYTALAEGLMIAAKRIEKNLTGRLTACVFIETKVNNMLVVRHDKAQACNELQEQVQHQMRSRHARTAADWSNPNRVA